MFAAKINKYALVRLMASIDEIEKKLKKKIWKNMQVSIFLWFINFSSRFLGSVTHYFCQSSDNVTLDSELGRVSRSSRNLGKVGHVLATRACTVNYSRTHIVGNVRSRDNTIKIIVFRPGVLRV